MAVVGYARVSSRGQSLDVQRAKLEGCDKIYEEKESATSARRPALTQCLEYVREGDTLLVSRLDRLARSILHLCQIAADLDRKGVSLRVLDQAIDTGTATGRLLFHVLGAIAEFETELRRERQADGIALARARGVKLGSAPKLTKDHAIKLADLRAEGYSIGWLMRTYGLSKSTVYRYLRNGSAAASPSSVAAEA
jgi:DNA invertase Pin-like site-specific DNA recombinase